MFASYEFRMKSKLKYLLRPFFGLNQGDEFRRVAISSHKNTVAIHDGSFIQRGRCFNDPFNYGGTHLIPINKLLFQRDEFRPFEFLTVDSATKFVGRYQ